MAAKPTKPGPTDAPTSPSAPAWPTLEVIERRIASGARNILRPRDVPLQHQPEPMQTRIVNTALESRWHQITTELGWIPVTAGEIAGGLQGDMIERDGRVVMGEGGREVLVKMPLRLYTAVLRSRARKEDRAMKDRNKFRGRVQAAMEREAETTDAAGAEQLERAADRLGGIEVEQFEVSRERVPIPVDK